MFMSSGTNRGRGTFSGQNPRRFSNGQSSNDGSVFNDQENTYGAPVRRGGYGNARGTYFNSQSTRGTFYNSQSTRGIRNGQSTSRFYNAQSSHVDSSFKDQDNKANTRGIPNDHSSHAASLFNQQSTRGRSRFYPTVTVSPSGQVVTEPPPPIALRITEKDKEEFGEEIAKKLIEHTIPRSHAEPGFAPKARSASEIYDEDVKHADEYANIIDEDDDVEIVGDFEDLQLLDTWKAAEFVDKLYENVKRAKYVRPRKIQSAAMPFILDGYDVKIQAETGSGKTLAYLLPIIDNCLKDKLDGSYIPEASSPYAVILAPTRELCVQTFEQASKLVDGTGLIVQRAYGTGLIVQRAYGEFDVKKNIRSLSGQCDIICATPGRFQHFVQEKFIKLDHVHFLVMDESDKLLTDDFEKTIKSALEFENKMPAAHQTIFCSATFTDDLMKKSEYYMRRPKNEVITIKSNNICPTKKVEQIFKLHVGTYKFGGIRSFFTEAIEKGEGFKCFIFCKTGQYSERLAVALEMDGISVYPISGARGQDLREQALTDFRENNSKIIALICTDVCSRGIDIKDADLVINCDLPHDYETYVHRVGRCGRIRHGKCISFVSRDTDLQLLLKIEQAMQASGQIIPPTLEEILRPSDGSQFKKQDKEDGSFIKDVDKKSEESVSAPEADEEKKPETAGEAEPSGKASEKSEESVTAPEADEEKKAETAGEAEPSGKASEVPLEKSEVDIIPTDPQKSEYYDMKSVDPQKSEPDDMKSVGLDVAAQKSKIPDEDEKDCW
uniref:ATP-dependent RNA helicase n=1 Tax=Panagrolaimus sp. PS1159 TaxID=55785 RepID=A0AC35FVC7_9BILA